MPPVSFRAAPLRAVLSFIVAVLLLGGCASLMRDPVRVSVAGLDPLVGRGSRCASC